jgi:hypothetical protein
MTESTESDLEHVIRSRPPWRRGEDLTECGEPGWLPALAERVHVVKMPTAQLADAMRQHGEDPRDETLWAIRIDQLDIALFGCPARKLKNEPGNEKD